MFFEIEGIAPDYFKILRLTFTQLYPYINEIYNLISYFPDVRFSHFPLCTLPPKFYPYVWRTLPEYEVSFPESCNHCNLKEFCNGIHKSYLRYIGSGEFKPTLANTDFLKSTLSKR